MLSSILSGQICVKIVISDETANETNITRAEMGIGGAPLVNLWVGWPVTVLFVSNTHGGLGN